MGEEEVLESEPDNKNSHAEPTQTGGTPGPRASWIRRIPPELPIFIFFLAVTVYLTWPVTRHITGTVYGFPSDNLGQMWSWWWFRNASALHGTAAFSPLIGYPFGQHFAAVPAEPILEYGARFMLLFASQTVVYNFLITISFFLSGVTMYYLVRHILHDRRIAFFAGLAFLVGAFHAVHAMLFVNLAQTEWMPLYILALLVFMEKPRPRNALFLGGAGVLVTATSVHYGFFMAIFTAAFLLGHFAYTRIRSHRAFARGESAAVTPLVVNRRTLALSCIVLVAVVVLVVPVFLLSQRGTNAKTNWPTRPTAGGVRNLDMDIAGSAKPWAYVLPEKENRYLGWITRDLAPGAVNSYENSLYLGITLLFLGALTVVLLVRPTKKRGPPADSAVPAGPGDPGMQSPAAGGVARVFDPKDRAIIWGLLTAGAVAFVLSMQPVITIGSTRIPLPSILMHYVVPWLRWYMRIGIVVIICLILLASYGLSWLLARARKKVMSTVLLIVIAIFMSIEFVLVPPAKYFQLSKTPPKLFQEVASLDSDGGLVIYPAFDPGFFNNQRYMYYQQTTKKAMLNGALDNSDGEALRRTVYNPFNPATPGILSRFGIEHVVYLDRMFEEYEGTEKKEKEITFLPPGLEVEAHAADKDLFGSGYIYRVTAQKADLVPIYMGDITTPLIDKGRVTVRLLERDGIIRIENYSGREMRAHVSVPVSNLANTHSVVLSAGGKVVWTGRLSDDQATVIDAGELVIPAAGLEMRLSSSGKLFHLSHAESDVFGAGNASLRLGDVTIEPL